MPSATKLPDSKVKEYDRIMAERKGVTRSVLVGVADPFGECSLSDFIHEAEILEKLGKAWKMEFCQATMGHARRSGGLWFAYTAERLPKAVIHVERFTGNFPSDSVTFWAEHIATGQQIAARYRLSFVVIAAFDDGRYSHTLSDGCNPRQYIGERLCKGPEFSGVTNMIAEIPANSFKKIGGSKTEAVDKSE